MYPAPLKPRQLLNDDYPRGAVADASGRFLFDMEGRPLTAKYIAGRRAAGGGNQGLTPMEKWDVATGLTGKSPREYANRTMKGNYGIYDLGYDEQGNLVSRDIRINRELRPDQKRYVEAHETSHGVHERTSGMDLSFVPEVQHELEQVYSTLNTGREGLRPPFRPQDRGYSDKQAPYELVAEFIRAYMTNPNFAKTVGPNAAAKIRAFVNSHPEWSKLIQFNTLGGLAVLGGAASDADAPSER